MGTKTGTKKPIHYWEKSLFAMLKGKYRIPSKEPVLNYSAMCWTCLKHKCEVVGIV